MDTLAGKATLNRNLLLEERICSLIGGSKFFPLRVEHFHKELGVQESKLALHVKTDGKSTKFSPLNPNIIDFSNIRDHWCNYAEVNMRLYIH